MGYETKLNSNSYNIYGYTPYGSNAFAMPNFGSSNAFQGYSQPYTDSFASTTTIQAPQPKEESFLEKHWGKMLLGAGVIAGAILTKGKLWAKEKPVTFETAQKNLSEIFRKDIPKEEAEAMMKRYQEIYKIEDKEEFIKQTFHQVKKDYGYEHIDMNYTLSKGKFLDGTKNTRGGFRPLGIEWKDLDNGMWNMVGINGNVAEFSLGESKEGLFSTIVHELQHCKQHEIAYRTDKEKFMQAIFNARLPDSKLIEERKMYKQGIETIYGPVWDKLPKIAPGTKEHEMGMKYIDNIEHYIKGDKPEYWTQLLEKEAHSAEDKAKKTLNFINSNYNKS